MKRKLNPDLAQVSRPHDHHFPHEEHWVFLRDPKVSGDCRELGIGAIEIDEIHDPIDMSALKQQITETKRKLAGLALEELGLSTHPAIEVAAEPHVILTKDCFDFKGTVRPLYLFGQAFCMKDPYTHGYIALRICSDFLKRQTKKT